MSILTAIQNFRASRKVSQEIKNADQTSESPKVRSWRPHLGIPFALAFVFALLAIAGTPALAATPDINLTWVGTMFASLIEAANTCAAPFQSFMQTWFPVLIELIVYGIIFGIIAVVGYAFRGIIMAGVKMVENILK